MRHFTLASILATALTLGLMTATPSMAQGTQPATKSDSKMAPAPKASESKMAPAPKAELLDINSATADQLDALPGVGPATAAAIVAYRRDHGPFSAVEQLLEVRGIGPSKFEQLRSLVVV